MKNVSSPFLVGYLLAFAATLAWSGIYVLSRGMAGLVTPLELAFWRWLVAFCAILPFTGRSLPVFWPIIKTHLLFLLGISLIGIVGFSVLIFQAGETTSAINMSLLAASAPIFMAFLSYVGFHERLSTRQLVGLAIAICGVMILVTGGELSRLKNLTFTRGDLWMLLAALLFAGYSILIRYRPSGLPASTFLTVIMGLGTVLLFPWVLWQWLNGISPLQPTLSICVGILYIGIGASTLAFGWWNAAIERIGAVRAGIVYYSIPLFSALLAACCLGESLTSDQLIGGCFVIGGIVFSSLDALRSSLPH